MLLGKIKPSDSYCNSSLTLSEIKVKIFSEAKMYHLGYMQIIY